MEHDSHKTIVIFRKDRDKYASITAVFPEEPADYAGHLMTCYAHIGQHSGCSKQWLYTTRRAKPDEFASLKTELESIGYNLEIRQRITREMDDTRYANARGLK